MATLHLLQSDFVTFFNSREYILPPCKKLVDSQNKPEQIVIHPKQNLEGNVEYVAGNQPTQIVYVELKYNPDINYRWWSYGVLAFGIVIYLLILFTTEFDGSFGLIANSLCCLSISFAAFLDAAFYKGKSEWQTSTGQSNKGSTVSIVIDVILGLIGFVIAVIFLSVP
mgnify:CR=1 FL=1